MSDIPKQLLAYWLAGPGAAKIGYGAPGQFDRAVAAITEATHGTLPLSVIEGMSANLIHMATGQWPGKHGRD